VENGKTDADFVANLLVNAMVK